MPMPMLPVPVPAVAVAKDASGDGGYLSANLARLALSVTRSRGGRARLHLQQPGGSVQRGPLLYMFSLCCVSN